MNAALDGPALALVAIVVYLIPSWIADKRRHRNRGAILATNILLGWTGIGWIAAFIWACTNDTEAAEKTAPHGRGPASA